MTEVLKVDRPEPESSTEETSPQEFLDLRTISLIPPGPEAFMADSRISSTPETRRKDTDDDDHDGTYQGGVLFDLSEK